ncbi:MAG TPA: adenosine kinase [Acidimicrobiales bacterium]|nr:adenosine kinase [Acidimicrobiales bacterium]
MTALSASGFDVVALGSAIVDLLVPVPPQTVAEAGLEAGTMTLIDATEAERLWGHFGTAGQVVAGGSAANTAVGVAALGRRAALVGRVGGDALGSAYAEDLVRAGVSFGAAGGPAALSEAGRGGTGRCYIIVTPDGQRTMRTYLGTAPDIAPEAVEAILEGGAAFVYLEGYLWDAPAASAAVQRAIDAAPAAGARRALTLSDPGCVERNRDGFLELIGAGAVDVLFANESEITGLWGTADFDRAVAETRAHCPLAALTRGAEGSVVVTPGDTLVVPAAPARVVDTTGAGDLYAAGFLTGLAAGLDLKACAALAGLAAADIISDYGARPHSDIRAGARSEGLLT